MQVDRLIIIIMMTQTVHNTMHSVNYYIDTVLLNNTLMFYQTWS